MLVLELSLSTTAEGNLTPHQEKALLQEELDALIPYSIVVS
jgi:hypothetical protein